MARNGPNADRNRCNTEQHAVEDPVALRSRFEEDYKVGVGGEPGKEVQSVPRGASQRI